MSGEAMIEGRCISPADQIGGTMAGGRGVSPGRRCIARRVSARSLAVLLLATVASLNQSMPDMIHVAMAQPAVRLTVVDSAVKIKPIQSVPTSPGVQIDLAAARNEYETAQLVLSSSVALSNVSVQLTPLTGPEGTIPQSDLQVFLSHYVSVDVPSDSNGAAGEWPDALVPLQAPFALRPGRNQPLWIQVYVRPGTPAGMYRGTLTLLGPDVPKTTADILLEVWDITLPDQRSLAFITGLDFDSIRRFDAAGKTVEAFEEQVLPLYYAALRRNRAYPLFVFRFPDYRENSRGEVSVDFAAFRRHLEAAYPMGSWGPMGIPLTENWPVDTARFPIFSPEYNRRVVAYLKQAVAFLENRGLLDKSFIYLPGADEPRQKAQYELIGKFVHLVRSADPRLRVLQTIHAECSDCNDRGGISALDHDVTLWSPNIAFFDSVAMRLEPRLFGLLGVRATPVQSGWSPTFTRQLRQRGAQIWWYVNPWTYVLDPPHPTYPNLFIDHQGIEHRVLGWMAFRYGVSAIATWNATFWREVSDVWVRLPRGEGNGGPAGDGSLFYPARGSSKVTGQPDPGSPIVSIRLALVREGIEDYELLNLLRQLGGAASADQFVENIVKSLREYERDPTQLKAVRRSVAAEIVRRTKANDAARSSTQPAGTQSRQAK